MSELKRSVPIFVFLFCALALIAVVSSCGKSGNKTFFNQSLGQSNSLGSETERYVARVETLAQAIDNTNALISPANVDASVFDQLKAAFVTALEACGTQRFVSAPPAGEENSVTDLAVNDVGGGAYTLTWTYRNLGDYDLNGEVGIPDITPIAQNYLANSTDGTGNDAQENWIDGSGDGEVGIPDITPIAQNYLSNVAGYNIYGTNSLSDPWTPVGTGIEITALEEGVFPPVITFDLASKDYELYKVVPRDSTGAEGADSNTARLQGPIEITGFSKASGMPGEIIEVYGTGFDEATLDLVFLWEGELCPVLAVETGLARIMVYPMAVGDYDVALAAGNVTSNTLTFTVEAIGALPYSKTEFAQHVEDGLDALVTITDDTITELEAYPELGLSTQDYTDLHNVMDVANTLAAEVNTELAELSDEDANMLQAMYANSGILGVLDEFAGIDMSKTRSPSSGLNLNTLLYRLDTTSMVLSNLGVVMDVVNLVSIVATAISGGAAAPVLGLSFTTTVILTLVDFVIDTFIPTDLKGMTYNGTLYPNFIYPDMDGDITKDYEVLEFGTTPVYPLKGSFTNDSMAVANTFTAIVNITLARLIPTIAPDEVKSIGEQLKNFMLAMFESIHVDPVTYLVGSIGGSFGDFYICSPPIEVELDSTLYRIDLEDLLPILFPGLGDILELIGVLDALGINIVAADSVIVSDPEVMTYDYDARTLTLLKGGQVDIDTWGRRFEDIYRVRKVGWPITVEAETTHRLYVEPDKPKNISATDGMIADQVDVTWTKSPGANGYVIYRDSTTTVYDTVDDVSIYSDTQLGEAVSPPDYSEHAYWVSATYDNGTVKVEGEQGIPDMGFALEGVLYDDFYYIHNQEDLDNFKQYSGVTLTLFIQFMDGTTDCTGLENLKVTGQDLVIGGEVYDDEGNSLGYSNQDLVSLQGLSNVRSIGKNEYCGLKVNDNPLLQDLTGLSGLASTHAMWIFRNPEFVSFDGLTSITKLNDIQITDCPKVTSLTSIPDTIGDRIDTLFVDNIGIENFVGIDRFDSVGDFSMRNCASVTNFHGLNKLKSLDSLDLYYNPGITDFTGFDEIESIGEFEFGDNPALASMAGMPMLTTIGGFLAKNNDSLTNLAGMEGVTHIGNLSVNSSDLTSLTGLSGVTDIDEMHVAYNNSLTSLSGLACPTIDYIGIFDNSGIQSLAGLNSLQVVDEIELVRNHHLADISALAGVQSINHFFIQGADALKNTGGALNSVTSMNGIGIEGSGLETIGSFNSLTTIGGITIGWSPNLTAITGFSGLNEVTGGISLIEDFDLADISGFSGLGKVGGRLYVDTCTSIENFDQLSSLSYVGSLDIMRNDNLNDLEAFYDLSAWTGGYVLPDGLRAMFNISLSNQDFLDMVDAWGGASMVSNGVDGIADNG
jgi:hypothetical protein